MSGVRNNPKRGGDKVKPNYDEDSNIVDVDEENDESLMNSPPAKKRGKKRGKKQSGPAKVGKGGRKKKAEDSDVDYCGEGNDSDDNSVELVVPKKKKKKEPKKRRKQLPRFGGIGHPGIRAGGKSMSRDEYDSVIADMNGWAGM